MKPFIRFIAFTLPGFFLAGCLASNAFIESAPSRDPNLNPQAKIFLLVAPSLTQKQKNVANEVVKSLQQSGFTITGEEQAEYIIDIQFRSSPEQTTTIFSPGAPGQVTSSLEVIGGDSHVVASWAYLCFFVYKKAEVRQNHVVPVWAAQIAADSRDVAGKEGQLTVALFRHLGEQVKKAIPLTGN